jgi:hypothetical protein
MDIRYIAWAGYDLLGAAVSTGVSDPPGLESKELQSTKKVQAKEVTPSLRGRMAIQPSARIIHGPRRPFPGPTNI